MEITDELIFRYVTETAFEDEIFFLDRAMSEDLELLKRVRALNYLRENFETVMEQWSAAGYAEAKKKLGLTRRLVEAAQSNPALATKIHSSIQSLFQGAAVGLKFLSNKAEKIASIGWNLLPDGHEFSLEPAFEGIGIPPDRNLLNHLQQGCQHLTDDNADAAEEALKEVVKLRRAIFSQKAESSVTSGQDYSIKIRVDCIKQSVTLTCTATRAAAPIPSLAILLPDDPEKVLQLAEFSPGQVENTWVAEMFPVPDGAGALIIE